MYLALSGLTTTAAYAGATLLPNTQLIASVMQSSSATLSEKLRLVVSLLGSITTNFSSLSATYTILVALLFGLNVGMITFFLRNRAGTPSGTGIATGTLGTVTGLLGVGCAACGSFLLTTTLAWTGAGVVVVSLPLKGAEFGIVAVGLLLISLYLAAKKITNPLVCGV